MCHSHSLTNKTLNFSWYLKEFVNVSFYIKIKNDYICNDNNFSIPAIINNLIINNIRVGGINTGKLKK
jgi:hypothetical protein